MNTAGPEIWRENRKKVETRPKQCLTWNMA